MRVFIAIIVGLCIALPAAAQYPAQFPDKPVTMLAGYPPCGLVDIVARLVAEGMKPKFPRGLNVVNRPGAAGSLAVPGGVGSGPPGHPTVPSPRSAPALPPQRPQLR